MIRNRYYRLNEKGIDRIIDDLDESLIGKQIFLHSPMTCACNSSGRGVCKRCYGNLYYTNRKINIGKIAAEILTSKITQRLLSSKHIIEIIIMAMKWLPDFFSFFEVNADNIILRDDINTKKYNVLIDPDNIELVVYETSTINSDEDSVEDTNDYNEYITEFIIKSSDGESYEIRTEDYTSLYISKELNEIIRKTAVDDDGLISVPLSALDDIPIFYVKITNNEMNKLMDDIIAILNKKAITSNFDKDEILEQLVNLVIESGLGVDSVHLETILSNQLVNPDDIINKPNWNDPNARYKVITLNDALTYNSSVIISLLYQDMKKTLYNPLTYSKKGPSFFDLFFMESPQNYISEELLTDDTGVVEEEKNVYMCKWVEKN